MINFDPTVGDEIKKTRPAVVVSSDALGRLNLKLVAPITEWQASFTHSLWHVPLNPNSGNGLRKASAVDAFQLRGVDIARFVKWLGRLSADEMAEIAAAVAAVVEYE